jgi:hypothetical protein
MSNIVLHRGQSLVYKDLFIGNKVRHATVVASRGFGKSYLGGTAVSTAVNELMELDFSVPNKNVYAVAPTHQQVQDIYMPLLEYQLGSFRYASRIVRGEGLIEYPGNVNLRLVSYEAIERLRGNGAYFILVDEPASYGTGGNGHKDAWESVLLPLITTRWSAMKAREYGSKPGRSLTIGTPKGFNYFYDLFNRPEIDDSYKSYRFDYTKSPNLDPEEIEKARRTMDPIEFAREYEASFEESGNRVFYCFDRTIHVRKDIEDFFPATPESRGEDVHISLDFNVGIMAASAHAIRGSQVHTIEEFSGFPDTETIAKMFKERYKDKGHRVFVYPDPTGKSRKTSAAVGKTDFTILQSYGLDVLAKNGSPPIVDSVKAVNRMLKTADGKISYYVSNKCTGTIKSLERTAWVDNKPDLAVIDKSQGVEHFSDGLRYFFDYKFPVLAGTNRSIRGRHF